MTPERTDPTARPTDPAGGAGFPRWQERPSTASPPEEDDRFAELARELTAEEQAALRRDPAMLEGYRRLRDKLLAGPPLAEEDELAYVTGDLTREEEGALLRELAGEETVLRELRAMRAALQAPEEVAAGAESVEEKERRAAVEALGECGAAALATLVGQRHADSFPSLNERYAQGCGRERDFVPGLFTPVRRAWFRACHTLVHAERDERCGGPLWGALEQLPEEQCELAWLHGDIAHELHERQRSLETARPALEALAESRQQPLGLVLDIAQELLTEPTVLGRIAGSGASRAAWHGDLRAAESEVSVATVIEGEEALADERTACVGYLTLEVVERQAEQPTALSLYPAPSMALWERDAEFRAVEAVAQAYGTTLLGEARVAVQVRWRLNCGLTHCLPARLCGSTLGLAFGVLLRRLLALRVEEVPRASLHGVAIMGGLTPRGDAPPIGTCVLDPMNADGIHTVVTPFGQAKHPSFIPTLYGFSLLGGAVQVLPVESVHDAEEKLALDAQTRWRGIDFSQPDAPLGFVGRKQLTARVLHFLRDHRSGYAVVTGPMGCGKTAFLQYLLHRLLETGGCRVAAYFVPSQPGVAMQGERAMQSLYFQLRREYAIAEPEAWAGWEWRRKLEELMKLLSDRVVASGRKQVLIVDAADELEMPAEQRFLPDLLPAELPPGFIGILSSGRNFDGLRKPEVQAEYYAMGRETPGATLETDDREDLRQFLARQRLFKLPPKLVAEMLRERKPTQPQAVFLTVVTILTELRDGMLEPSRHQRHLENVDLWLCPPERLIKSKVERVLKRADCTRMRDREVGGILGLLAVAREPLSRAMLREFGLWDPTLMPDVLDDAAEFCQPRPAGQTAEEARFIFEHQGYPNEIVKIITDPGVEHCHARLGSACSQWRRLRGPARRYALRHAPAHLRRAGQMWRELYEILSDLEYLEERMTPSADRALASAGENEPQRLVGRTLRDFHLALRGPRSFPRHDERRPAVEALSRALVSRAFALLELPWLLVQELYNALPPSCLESQDLGGKLRAAIARSPRIVLQRTHRTGQALRNVEPFRLKGHSDTVNAVALSPDEATLASASDDGTLMLWRTDSGELEYVLRGHTEAVRSVAWSRSNRFLASAGECVRLWNPETGENCGGLEVKGGAALVAFSPQQELLAVAGCDGSLHFYEPEIGVPLVTACESGPEIRCLAFSNDGAVLAVGLGERATSTSVHLYDTATGRLLRTLPALGYYVAGLAFSPDDRLLVVGGGIREGEVRLFDAANGAFQRKLVVHRAGVSALAVSPGGTLVTASFDFSIGLRHLATGTVLDTSGSHKGVVRDVIVLRAGDLIISAGADHEVIVWRVDRATTLGSLHGPVPAKRHAHDDIVYATRFSRDGERIASASRDTTARASRVDGSGEVLTVRVEGDPMNIAVLSPDNAFLAIGSKTHVRIVNAATGAEVHRLQGHELWVLDAAWTPDGRFLVTVSEDGAAMVWDTRTGAWLRTLQASGARLRAVAISPDGRLVATAGEDARIYLWDLHAGQLLRTILGHKLRIKALAFSPHGLLASAGSDDFILIHDPHTGRLCVTLSAPAQEIWTLRFAPERFLAAGSKDGLARLYDFGTGELVAGLVCGDAVQDVWFSADGTEFRAVERGGGSLTPQVHITRIVHPAVR